MATRCKVCQAPILSTVEKQYGKCTACLKKERMAQASQIVSRVETGEPATPTRIHKGEPACIPLQDSDKANSVLLTFRVCPIVEDLLSKRIQEGELTKAAYLRAILYRELGYE